MGPGMAWDHSDGRFSGILSEAYRFGLDLALGHC